MTELLQKAFGEISKLPPQAQDAWAQQLLDELEADNKWDELFARSPESLEKLGAEALAEDEAGLTQSGDW